MPVELAEVVEPSSPDPVTIPPLASIANSSLADLAAHLDDRSGGYKVLHRDRAIAITDFAMVEADLIAVATHGRRGLARRLLGSLALQVVHRACCPVLVVPPPPFDW